MNTKKNLNDNLFLRLLTDNGFKKKWILILGGIFSVGLIIRIFEIPSELPLTLDALEYFFYATDVSIHTQLPPNYTPINNGWPIFMSFFMSFFDFETTQSYMFLQRTISAIISAATIIPMFFLCKKYFGVFYSLIGAFIFAIEPRIIQNSAMGITEPLFLILSVTGFTLFLSSKKQLIYLSFAVVTLASIIRGEGVLLLLAMFILLLIKFRKNKSNIPHILLIISLVFLIMLPMSVYRVDIINSDGMFMRISTTSSSISEKTTDAKNSYLLNGIENFPKFFGWNLIPIFLIFIPIGFIMILKQKNFDTLSILISSFMISLSAVHAYSVPVADTRFLLPLYPFLIIGTLFGIKFFIEKMKKPKIVFVIIMGFIIVSSSLFLSMKAIDYEHDMETFLISQKITSDFKIFNEFYPESRYLESSDLPENWDDFRNIFYTERVDQTSFRKTISHNFELIPLTNHKSIEEFILKNKNIGLDHIIVDEKEIRPEFIKHIFLNEEKYPYLTKIYDSKEDGFNYHVKLFEIEYKKLQNVK